MSLSKFRWCEDVCSYVRFRPDHEAIRRELYAHMEDSVGELTASGLTEEEAERAMLERMGSPAEVGKQLNAVHSPRLGWLWVASKWLVRLCLAAVLLLLVTAPSRLYLDLEDLAGASLSESTRVWGCTDHSDGYLFSIDQAAVWENADPADGLGTVKLRLRAWDLMGSGYMNVAYRFYLVDSGGETHAHVGYAAGEDEKESSFTVETYRRILSTTYIISVDGMPLDTRWVELRYTDHGRDVVLRVELPGGEGA